MKEEQLRFITWNMGGFAYRRMQASAWSYLVNTLKPDIGVLQEIPHSGPKFLLETGQVFGNRGGAYGTGIFSVRALAHKITVDEALSHSSSGWYVSAANVRGFYAPFSILSAHVGPGKDQKSYLRELLTILEEALRRLPTVVGGDFNACRH
jgi:exonuclease III